MVIPKKTLFAIISVFPLIGLLLFKGNIGGIIILFVGISTGIFIGMGLQENK